MNHLSKKRIVALALAIPLAGCSAQGLSALPSTGVAAAGTRIAAPIAQGHKSPAWSSAFLYVLNVAGSSSSSSGSGNGSLNVYRVGRPRLLNTITNGIDTPRTLTFDQNGNVYVVNDGNSSSSSSSSGANGSITVYAGHGSGLIATITNGINEPVADAVDSRGDLYVANDGSSGSSSSSSSQGSVTIYRHHFHLVDTLTEGIASPRALGIDGSGNLYVLNGASSSSSSSSSSSASVTIYNPRHRLIGTLSSGISAPVAMAVDSAGDVMVANSSASSASGGSGNGAVQVFAAGSTSPTATISTGIDDPRALALDSSGNLYVANAAGGSSSSSSSGSGGSVSVYPSGSSTPSLTIGQGINAPDALAVAPNGWLYVANVASTSSSSSGSGASVQVYLPGQTSPRFTITQGISVPVALGVN